MVSPSIYTKFRLPDGPSEVIRLLTIESDIGKQTVRCHMFTVPLINDPSYYALSYTWRIRDVDSRMISQMPTAEERPHVIDCHGDKIPVYYNLFQALLRLGQPPYRGAQFWIDAICIDQNNIEERSHQVGLMAQIYRRAQKVVVWLGPSDEHIRPASQLIDALCSLPEDIRHSITPKNVATTEIMALLKLNPYEQSFWQSLAHFFRRDWFSRAWVIQEYILAQDIEVLCGMDHVLRWADLETVSHFLTTTAWSRTFRDPIFLGFSDILPNHRAPTQLRAAKNDLYLKDPLLRCLIRSRMHSCLHAIDKVICLYGIASTQTRTTSDFLKADYTLSAYQAFTNTARYILESSHDLHILAHAEGQDFRKVFNIPTWVPDWSVQEPIGIGKTGHERYWAAADLPKSLIEFPQPHILRLKAAHIADISHFGETKEEVSKTKTCRLWLDLLNSFSNNYHGGQPIIEAFWRTLIYDTGPDGDCPAQFEIGRSFGAWFAEYGSLNGTLMHRHQDALQALRSDSNSHVHRDTHTNETKKLSVVPISHDSAHFDLCYHFRTLLRPFRTNNGLLGLGTQSLRVNDSVWIVPGSRIPLILRISLNHNSKDSPGRYELVGGAYLHGLMHGQAFDKGGPLGDKYTQLIFQTIDLD